MIEILSIILQAESDAEASIILCKMRTVPDLQGPKMAVPQERTLLTKKIICGFVFVAAGINENARNIIFDMLFCRNGGV